MNSIEYSERQWGRSGAGVLRGTSPVGSARWPAKDGEGFAGTPGAEWNVGGQCLVIEPDVGSGRDWEHSAWFQEWEEMAYARLGEKAILPYA